MKINKICCIGAGYVGGRGERAEGDPGAAGGGRGCTDKQGVALRC